MNQTTPRRIWLCADDYGIAPGVNAAIRDLVARGRLNATSVMVVAPSFSRAEAVALDTLNADRQRVSIGPSRSSPIKRVAREVIETHDCYCIRHVQVRSAQVQIIASQVVRLPARVVVVRHVSVAWSKWHPSDLVLAERHERD
jgi:hypothetical protein